MTARVCGVRGLRKTAVARADGKNGFIATAGSWTICSDCVDETSTHKDVVQPWMSMKLPRMVLTADL
jgi:hypothetical protein